MSSISFYNPGYFFALLFIAVIILIHFLKRPHTINLNFSTFRFFDQKAIIKRKTRKLRKFLQFLTRCAIVSVVIVLFARPFDKSEPLNKLHSPETQIYIWIDPTLSMDYSDGSKSVGQISAEIADSLQKLIPVASKVFLFDHDSKTFLLKDKSTSYNSSYLPSDLKEALEQIKYKSFDTEPFVVILSDFQIQLKKIVENNMAGLEKKINIVCVPVTPKKPWNYSLIGAQIQSQDETEIKATIKTQGKSLNKGEIIAESNRMRIGKEVVHVAENENASVKITGKKMSNSMGTLKLRSLDPLPFDNSAFFTLQTLTSSRVLIVGDKKKCIPIAFALNASSRGEWRPVIIKDGSELTFDDLDSAELIILNELMHPSYGLNAFLNDPSMIKKPVIYCCSVDEGSMQWSNTMLSEMLPSFNRYSVENFDNPLSALLPDTTSQIWRHFQKVRSDDVAVYKRCSGIGGDVLLMLTDGSALMIKTVDKKGRTWFVLTTPIGVTDANNISETGFFVPFIDRTCRYALSSQKLHEKSFIAGKMYRNPYFGSGSDMIILDDQSKLVKTVYKDQSFFRYDKPGIYKIVHPGQSSFLVAVQSDSAESILSYDLPDNRKYPNLMVIDHQRFLDTISRIGHTVFDNILWILLVVLLLFEMFLWERTSQKIKNKKTNPNILN